MYHPGMTAEAVPLYAPPKRRLPFALLLGLAWVVACEALLFTDVALSNRGRIHTTDDRLAVPPSTTPLGHLARWAAVNFTAIVWVGYLILCEGLLTLATGKSPIRKRPHHFALLCLASVFIWAVFDMINFNLGMRAWLYIGMPGTPGIPGGFADRALGYFLAFATIVPGMLLSGQLLLDMGWLDWARAGNCGAGVPPASSKLCFPH